MAAKQPRRSALTSRQWRLLGVALLLIVLAVAALSAGARRSCLVTVYADGETSTVTLPRSASVAMGLDAAGIALGQLDRVSLPLTSTLSASSSITVTRVQVSETVRSVVVAAPREVTADATRPRGYRDLVQAGAPGLKEIIEEVTLEDGRVAGVRIVCEQIVRAPVVERMIEGTRADPAIDAFREAALGYLGRGGVTRLSPSVVEQTVFELSRLRGDRYGSVRVLTQPSGRPWLVLTTFARSPQEVVLFIFWWTDELHAFAQVLDEGLYLLDARAQETADAIELGLVVSTDQGKETMAPHFVLRRLPQKPAPADTWRAVWSSFDKPDWRSSQGAVTLAGDDLAQITVRGASTAADDGAAVRIAECAGCPRRRFDSVWRRSGDVFVLASRTLVATPYATLWAFVNGLSDATDVAPLAEGRGVVDAALAAGLGRRDLRWTVSGSEQDTAFDLRANGAGLRVTLAPRGASWVISSVGPIAAQGKIIYTGTRPVVRGMYVTDTAASSPPLLLADGQRYVWSPDYRRVAYEWQGTIHIAASDGSNQRRLGAGSGPAWSPDGRRLAYTRPSSTGSVIVLANVDEGTETVLVGGSRPAWAPASNGESDRLAFAGGGEGDGATAIHVIDVATGALSLLASDGNEPLWSPNGDAVAFLTSRQEIVVVTVAPAGVATVGPGAGYTWTKDGTALMFLSAAPAGRLLRWERQSGQTTAVLERGDIDGFALSPDGSQLVVSAAGNSGLWLARSDGSDLRKLGDGRDPVWTWLPRAGR